jgi:hypothetical protein
VGDLVSDLPLLTRRTLLRALGVAAVGLLAGCRSAKRPAAARASVTSPAPHSSSPPLPSLPSLPVARSSGPAVAQPTLSPDESLARRVAVAETALVAAYDAAAVQHPELASQLAPFRADHAAHANALVPGAASPAPRIAVPSSTAPSSAPPSGTTPSGTPLSSVAPSSAPPPNPIIAALAALESSAAAARVDDLATTTGSLARLLASIGGCEAAHAALLAAATSVPAAP